MPLLNTSIPNLAQGVSQQPDNLRYPGQCDEQVNAWSTVVEGLVKRPNSRFLYDTALGANVSSDLFTHFVDRDEQNKYVITYDSVNGLKAKDLTVNNSSAGDLTITVEDATAGTYVSVSNPLTDLTALTIADSTFIVNKTKTVEAKSILQNPLEKEALIFVKQGDYAKGYSIFIDGALVPVGGSYQGVTLQNSNHDWDHISPKQTESTYISGPSSAALNADTTYIAGGLTACLNTRFPASTVNVMNTVSISSPNGGAGYLKPINSEVTDYKVEVTINQSSGLSGPAETAKGEAVIDSSGTITGVNLTHIGANFASTGLIPTADLQITVVELMYSDKFYVSGSKWLDVSLYSDYVSRVTSTANTANWAFSTVAGTPFTVDHKGSVIKITNSLNKDFQVRVTDGLANQGLGVIYKEVSSITDLPTNCYNGFRIKIIGDAELEQDDYYVRFKTKDNEDFGEGSWVETVGWTQDGSATGDSQFIDNALDEDTMPVRLVPTPSTGKITGFTLKVVDWVNRNSGDDNSNPLPSFKGKKINDIFFFKNRLGFLADDSVVFSEADEYFNFFRTTTQSLLDSAPIDVGISHTKISLLKYAQAFQEKLMLFSSKTQFVLRGADLLTPKTVTISPVTEYDVSESIRPLALSSYIYFNFKRNNFEGLLEYTVDNNTETYGAAEITEQVNKYIPSNIVRMEGSAAENMIVVQSNSNYNKLFLYKYFWQGREKIQSSWMSFTFTRKVISFKFIESTLYVITTDSDGTYLEEIPMENGLTDTGKDYSLLLDGRVDGNSSYVGLGGWYPTGTTLSINGTTVSNVSLIVGANGFKFQSGMSFYTKNGNKRTLTIDNADPTRAAVSGLIASFVSYEGGLYLCTVGHTSSSSILPTNTAYWNNAAGLIDSAPAWSPDGYEYISQYDFFVGFEYDMLYRFSKQNLKQPTERGGRSASDYTYQTIRNGSIEYADTGHFNVEVTPKFRDTYTYTYNPALLASVSTLNKFTPETGFFKFAVQAQPNDATIEIKSSSALPVKLLAAEFESTIISRSKRYGG